MQRTLNARLGLPNHEGYKLWGPDDLRAALRLVGDVRSATPQTIAEAPRRGMIADSRHRR